MTAGPARSTNWQRGKLKVAVAICPEVRGGLPPRPSAETQAGRADVWEGRAQVLTGHFTSAFSTVARWQRHHIRIAILKAVQPILRQPVDL